jgi:hypothetical protein
MSRASILSMIACIIWVVSHQASAQVTKTVDVDANWIGFMNVFELPENGGEFIFGEPWENTEELTAIFTPGPVLELGPNTIGDPNEFWYQDTCNCATDPLNPGGPGQAGNKIMEANMYVEETDTLNGQTVTFEGNVLSNSFTFEHETIAFIKDFAPDYSSFTEEIAFLDAPGPFSISLPTSADLGRHVQYGFQTIGPNVWVTDVAPFGIVEIEAIGSVITGDYDDSGAVGQGDLNLVLQNWGVTPPPVPTGWINEQPADGVIIGQSNLNGVLQNWGNTSSVASVGAVPEPSSLLLLIVGAGLGYAGKRGRRVSA